MKIALFADDSPQAKRAGDELRKSYDFVDPVDADVGVALGGDGYILSILHENIERQLPIYGMNRGTVGFMLNAYNAQNLLERLNQAITVTLHPLKFTAMLQNGEQVSGFAINEVSFIRQSQQAAHLDIIIDGACQMEKIFADGVCIATPAGSTAYNFALNGPVLPLRAPVLAITPISVFRPRRWRGAIVMNTVEIGIRIHAPQKRPVNLAADTIMVTDIISATITEDQTINVPILFNPDQTLEERIFKEQFMS